jgi:hypothetical protein
VSFPLRRTGERLLFIQPSLAGSYKHYAALFASDGKAFAGQLFHIIHSNPWVLKRLSRGIFGGFSMSSGLQETAIDEIVARCNGDIRGALKALLLVNEQLEAELAQLHAAVAHGRLTGPNRNLLH